MSAQIVSIEPENMGESLKIVCRWFRPTGAEDQVKRSWQQARIADLFRPPRQLAWVKPDTRIYFINCVCACSDSARQSTKTTVGHPFYQSLLLVWGIGDKGQQLEYPVLINPSHAQGFQCLRRTMVSQSLFR